MTDEFYESDDEDNALVICDHQFSEEEINVAKKALKAFSERMTPMYVGREAIKFLRFQKKIALRMLSSVLTVGKISRNFAQGTFTFTINELTVLRDALSFFVTLESSLFRKKEDVLRFRHYQATAQHLLGSL